MPISSFDAVLMLYSDAVARREDNEDSCASVHGSSAELSIHMNSSSRTKMRGGMAPISAISLAVHYAVELSRRPARISGASAIELVPSSKINRLIENQVCAAWLAYRLRSGGTCPPR
jgi:hypothetical protein